MTTSRKTLTDLLAPSFYGLHHDVQAHRHTHYILEGGRGSCKSTFVSVEVVLLLLKNPDCHALVLRKVGETLRDSVYAQYVWSICALGLESMFSFKVSPMEIVYRRTGQKILFRGADRPEKLKSIKVPFGYIGITHFEEKDQFSGRQEIRSILQSTMRGGAQFWNFESNNPPVSRSNWANQDSMLVIPGRIVHKSNYQDVPAEWLGEQFFDEARALKEINPRAYEHEYMGVATGTGGAVFENLDLRALNETELERFDRIYNGVDWGYYPDPWAYNRMHYDAARRVLYIFGELTRYKAGNRETADALIDYGAGPAERITADSAEPKSIGDYKRFGLNCRGAEKGPGSVEYSMKWLQSLKSIVIDPARCPDTAREFAQYEYERTKDGEIMSGYPDRDNHHIDAVRYALEPVWRRRGK